MFTTKLNIMVPVLGILIALIEPAFAQLTPVPGPIIGALNRLSFIMARLANSRGSPQVTRHRRAFARRCRAKGRELSGPVTVV